MSKAQRLRLVRLLLELDLFLLFRASPSIAGVLVCDCVVYFPCLRALRHSSFPLQRSLPSHPEPYQRHGCFPRTRKATEVQGTGQPQDSSGPGLSLFRVRRVERLCAHSFLPYSGYSDIGLISMQSHIRTTTQRILPAAAHTLTLLMALRSCSSRSASSVITFPQDFQDYLRDLQVVRFVAIRLDE